MTNVIPFVFITRFLMIERNRKPFIVCYQPQLQEVGWKPLEVFQTNRGKEEVRAGPVPKAGCPRVTGDKRRVDVLKAAWLRLGLLGFGIDFRHWG